MAFPQQAKTKMYFAKFAVHLAVLIPLLSAVRSEPDALIRFPDGSVVEIENRQVRVPNTSGGELLPHTVNSNSRSTSNGNLLAGGDIHRIETRSNTQHFCGELLVNALALVCKGNYKKRSRIGSTPIQSSQNNLNFDADDLSKTETDNNLPDFFDLIKAANSRHERHTRAVSIGQLSLSGLEDRPSKRGVVDECCKKPCSAATLAQYCGI